MLNVQTVKGFLPLENIQDFNIKTEFGGNQILSFDISTRDEYYRYINNRSLLKYNDNEYLVDSINQRKTKTSITATLNMNDWKGIIHHIWDSTYALFSDIMLSIKPAGWIIEDEASVTGRKTMHLSGVSDYDVLMNCKEIYNIAYEFHTSEKRIRILKPDTYQSRGLYATEELNATNIEYKGDTKAFATRLYAYGKKTEEKDKNGNVTSTSYVTFAGINGGKEYINNLTFSDKIVSAYWSDERYTVPEDLLKDATEKLKILSRPVSSYGFDLLDLSRVDKRYKHLSFKMYDKVTLIASGEKVEHQIVEYTEYPNNPNKNKVILSTAFKKITGTIENINQQITNIDTDLSVKENMINEVKRDVQSNSSRIENTYTKGEADTIQKSIIEQTNEAIDLSISEVNERIETIDIKAIQLNLIKTGTVLNQDVSSISLSAQITQNAQDITEGISDLCFTWQRKSKDAEADAKWNEEHVRIKSITVTNDDVDQSASFQVTVKTESYTKISGYETITDESDIPKLSVFIDSNLPEYQRCDELEMDPSWNPLILTPEVKDGLLQIPLSSCEIAWKRSDCAIGEGETIVDGTLKVVNNKLSEVASGTITYICEVKFKNYMSLASKSFVLIADGSTGTGVKSVSAEHYLSTSKEEQEGGEWLEKPPTWSTGKYLWTRTKTIFTDDTETYTEPVCDSSWEAVNELEETVNKKIDADLSTVEERITETYNSALELTKSEINMSVERVSESASSTLELLKGVQNQLILTNEQTAFIKTTTEKLANMMEGKADSTTIEEWARFDGSSLELGASNSPFKAILSNTELAFWQGNTKVAWISNNELHIAHAVVMETLRIGSFQMQHIKGIGLVLNRWE